MELFIFLCSSLAIIAGSFGQVTNATVQIGHCQLGIDAFARIEAEHYDFTSGVKIYENGKVVGAIQQGDILGYYNVNFHEGASGVHIRLGSGIPVLRVVQVHLHLDNVHTPPFVTIDVGSTGDYRSFHTLSVYLTYTPKGTHDLFFSFSDQDANKGVVDVDWFQFFKMLLPVP